ncbi:MAG: NAD(P)-dependent oxidoreductase [Candidatus Methanomethyliaceae archaeon]
MRIAVTGASGFIGQAVLKELCRRGITASGCARTNVKLIEMLGHRGIAIDIHSPPDSVFDKLGKPDTLIHLAWGGLPNYGSLKHFEQELPAHYKFLKHLVEAGVSYLLVAGTCLEYGMQFGSLSETCFPRPETPYAFAKDALRRMLTLLKKEKNFNLTWARIFYVYGEGQSETSIFSQLRRAVSSGARIFNMSGGEQLRDYLPVEAVASILVNLALLRKDIGVVNVCSGKPVSMRRLVESWIRENGWSIELNLGYYPYPDYEPMAFWGDRSKLEAVLEGRCP